MVLIFCTVWKGGIHLLHKEEKTTKGLKNINIKQKLKIEESYKTISNLKPEISKLTEQLKEKR